MASSLPPYIPFFLEILLLVSVGTSTPLRELFALSLVLIVRLQIALSTAGSQGVRYKSEQSDDVTLIAPRLDSSTPSEGLTQDAATLELGQNKRTDH
ncbi:hypothetical protein B0H13DRAFT_2302424 [Mycena leptocephala]|nr:hypothetical protein B0H13DRAFT_2302424 [Mycena leptocephala]